MSESEESKPGDAEWGLVEPFDIDNGELDCVNPKTVFCLGFEFCDVRTLLEGTYPISKTIHTENVSRIKRMCIRRRRKFKIEPVPDMADQWHYLEIANVAGEFRQHGD